MIPTEFPDTASGIKNLDRFARQSSRPASAAKLFYFFLGFWAGVLAFLVGALIAN